MKQYTIAIDGPSGAGKSTSARALAEKLKIAYLDTGAMYRALAVALLADGISPRDAEKVKKVLPEYTIEIRFTEQGQHSLVNGIDQTDKLYTSEASMGASDVSKHPFVRQYLVGEQQRIAETTSFVLDGRDIGTVVLPEADVKFFLTASPEARAKRRWLDFQKKAEAITFEQVLQDINKRDKQDTEREASPLRRAEDAHLIDSTDLSFEDVLAEMLEIIEEKKIVAYAEKN